MLRAFALTAAATIGLAITPAVALATGVTFRPGAPGIGDPYFPLDGNGGYDVEHYDLDISYDPATDVLTGVAVIEATAKLDLSTFNLDLDGLNVRSITVDGRAARWTRSGGELTITPRKGLERRDDFKTVIRYDGVPKTLGDEIGALGFLHTDDGALIAGEPDAAATWYPVNDHPLDKASYSFRITVPRGLEAIANGELQGVRSDRGWTTWEWEAKEPMVSYVTTAAIGEFNVHAYKADGIRFLDAIDPDLFTKPAPRTGKQFAISGFGQPSYKRLARTIDVPAGGAKLSFWVTRDTERDWDFFFVEAHTAGADDWTTLPDAGGHTSQATDNVCPYWLDLHPFLEHYQTANADGGCDPHGTSGDWWAASGASDGYEQWTVDLARYAGKRIELSLSYASDDSIQRSGVYVDDVAVSRGPGSTSFENDGNPLDGWSVPGAPEGSEPNPNDWFAGTAADAPPSVGAIAQKAIDREPEIIRFLSGLFGPYPFSAAGSIVDDSPEIGFALETQTRPLFSRAFFDDFAGDPPDWVVAHEFAHQWAGDSVSLGGWRHTWLNEGFATYADWRWAEYTGARTVQDNFDFYASLTPDRPFWSVVIADPGPDQILDLPIYYRGAMTLHALRQKIGDRDFSRLLREWMRSHAGGNATIPEFIDLAERISRQNLRAFFTTWLYTPSKPAGIEPAAARAAPLVDSTCPWCRDADHARRGTPASRFTGSSSRG
jgi:Peptidase family M1 domain/Peptidase M1 N-terminal domain/Immune inhibitor A peptidase M6